MPWVPAGASMESWLAAGLLVARHSSDYHATTSKLLSAVVVQTSVLFA